MARKILFCASTVSHLTRFHLPYLRELRNRGFEVWAAAPGAREIPYAGRCVDLPLRKSMASPENLRAVRQLRALLREEEFTALSLHTALASAVARAAVLPLRRRPLVLNVVHGYLFGEESGAGRWKYLLPEKLCAAVTDLTAVMNAEDLRLAQKYRLAGRGTLCSIPGMGVDQWKFRPMPALERAGARAALGFHEDDAVAMYAAEFSPRKNQAALLRAFALAAADCPRLRLILAGDGALREECRALAQSLGVADRVEFPGQLAAMERWWPLCDFAVSSSRSEGLPFNLMEAMSCGLPVAATRVKGHVDLVEHGRTGFLCTPGADAELAAALRELAWSPAMRERMGQEAARRAEAWSLERVFPQVMQTVYGALL